MIDYARISQGCAESGTKGRCRWSRTWIAARRRRGLVRRQCAACSSLPFVRVQLTGRRNHAFVSGRRRGRWGDQVKITRRNAIGILASTRPRRCRAGRRGTGCGRRDGDHRMAGRCAAASRDRSQLGRSLAARHGAQGRRPSLSPTDGKALPLQSWPLAYWPDGSIKWTGLRHGQRGASGPFRSSHRAAPAAPAPRVTVTQTAQAIDIDTGTSAVPHPEARAGFLIESMTIDGRVVAREGTPGVHAGGPSTPGVLRFPEFTATSARSRWSRAARCARW